MEAQDRLAYGHDAYHGVCPGLGSLASLASRFASCPVQVESRTDHVKQPYLSIFRALYVVAALPSPPGLSASRQPWMR